MKAATIKNTPRLDFKGERLLCKCIKVYDGDTFTAAIQLGEYGIYRFNCRLLGIDTPEIRGGTDESKHAARVARDYVASQILDEVILMESEGFDKYGRLLVKVIGIHQDDASVKTIDLTADLLSKGYGVEYYV